MSDEEVKQTVKAEKASQRKFKEDHDVSAKALPQVLGSMHKLESKIEVKPAVDETAFNWKSILKK